MGKFEHESDCTQGKSWQVEVQMSFARGSHGHKGKTHSNFVPPESYLYETSFGEHKKRRRDETGASAHTH